MKMPEFTAEASLNSATRDFTCVMTTGAPSRSVIPASCYGKVHEYVEKITGSHWLAVHLAEWICH